MKIFSIFFVAAALFLVGCGGTKVALGDFNFSAPSSWTITKQSADKLNISSGDYTFSIEYALSSKSMAEDLPLVVGSEIKVYDISQCAELLCYGIVTDNKTATLTFVESDGSSDSMKYDIMEDAISFAKSASF